MTLSAEQMFQFFPLKINTGRQWWPALRIFGADETINQWRGGSARKWTQPRDLLLSLSLSPAPTFVRQASRDEARNVEFSSTRTLLAPKSLLVSCSSLAIAYFTDNTPIGYLNLYGIEYRVGEENFFLESSQIQNTNRRAEFGAPTLLAKGFLTSNTDATRGQHGRW